MDARQPTTSQDRGLARGRLHVLDVDAPQGWMSAMRVCGGLWTYDTTNGGRMQ